MMNNSQQFEHNNILLAVDGSLSAKAAAYTAIQVASALKWSVHALYVVDAAQVFEIYSDTSQELNKLGGEISDKETLTLFEEQGALVLAEIDELCQEAKVPVTTEMIFGGVSEIILETSKQFGLLAIGRWGNHHKANAQHLGNNFRKIAHHTHTPLLIGGDDKIPSKWQHILLAYDGSELSRMALSWTERLQRLFVDVTALSVEEKGEKDYAWLEERQKEIAKSTLKHYEFDRGAGEPGEIIASVASARQADLIVMGAYQHSGLLEWVMHSTLSSVIREVKIPILAAK